MCLVVVVLLFLAAPCVCLQFVILVFPDHTHYIKCSSFAFNAPVTHIKHVFFHLVVYLFFKHFSCKT